MKQQIIAALRQKMVEHDIPGLSVACLLRSGIECAAIGSADRERSESLSTRHRMPAGSVGKTFTAASALALVARGVVDLDASIANWLEHESWFADLPYASEMTLRMLLSHTSGIADHRAAPKFANGLQQALRKECPDRDLYFSPSTLVGYILDEPASFRPGSGYSYSETGYILSGMLVEKAGREPFYDQIRRCFLDKFQLDNTLPADRRDIPCLSQGYVESNEVGLPGFAVEQGRLALNPATEWAGGGFVSTASDLARWALLLFTGQAIEKPYLEHMLGRPVATGDPNYHYGLGCYMWHTNYGEAYGHSGESIGYRSIMAYFREFETAVSVQINSSRTAHSVLLELLNSFAQVAFERH